MTRHNAKPGSDFGHRNRVVPYNAKLRPLARALRKSGNLAEVLLWKAMKGKALGVEFHRQVPIGDYIVDFFCHERMVAIEVDGSRHHHPETSQNDLQRDRRLDELGVRVLRVQHGDVLQNIDRVVDMIREFVDEDQNTT